MRLRSVSQCQFCFHFSLSLVSVWRKLLHLMQTPSKELLHQRVSYFFMPVQTTCYYHDKKIFVLQVSATPDNSSPAFFNAWGPHVASCMAFSDPSEGLNVHLINHSSMLLSNIGWVWTHLWRGNHAKRMSLDLQHYVHRIPHWVYPQNWV